jgi:phosphocarrier protein FPr
MSKTTLLAPVAGRAVAVEEVPHPAIAQRMIGDGIAIDPSSSELRAPCDGTVASVHWCNHACTLLAPNGTELLLHIGVDTVALKGQGFTAHVQEGQAVRAGALLITFDRESIARQAPSLLTMMVVINGETHTVTDCVTGRPVAVGDPVMTTDGEPAAHTDAS